MSEDPAHSKFMEEQLDEARVAIDENKKLKTTTIDQLKKVEQEIAFILSKKPPRFQ